MSTVNIPQVFVSYNGDSPERLIEQSRAALKALRVAGESVAEANPNGRNFSTTEELQQALRLVEAYYAASRNLVEFFQNQSEAAQDYMDLRDRNR